MGIRSKIARATIGTLCLGSSLAHAAEFEIIAQTGEQAVTGAPEQFRRFVTDNNNQALPPPAINESNSILFHASLQGSGATPSTDKALYLRNSQNSAVIARRNNPVLPTVMDVVHSEFLSATLSRIEDLVLLRSRLGGSGVVPGTSDVALIRRNWQTTSIVSQTGAAVPQAGPGVTYNILFDPLLPSIFSHPMVVARVSPSFSTGVWMPDLATPQRMLPQSAAPSTLGATVSSFETVADTSGPAMYIATLTGGDVTSETANGTSISNATALYAELGGAHPTLVARTAQPLTPDPLGPVIGSIYAGVGAPSSNGIGDVLFAGSIIHRALGTQLGVGIWRWRAGVLTQLASSSSTIKNAPGVTLSGLGGATQQKNLEILEDGSALAHVTLTGTGITSLNNKALVRISSAGQIQLLAQAGTQATSVAAEQTFTNFGSTFRFRVSPNGSVAFVGDLQGPGVTPSNMTGVWVVEANGTAQLAVRSGQQVGVVEIVGIHASQPPLINDLGQAVVQILYRYIGDSPGNIRPGIVAKVPGGDLEFVAAQGQSIVATNGTTAPLLSYTVDSHQSLNHSGSFVFAAAFGVPQAIIRVQLAPEMPCDADFDGSGSVDVADIFAFLSAWFALSPAADFTGNGQIQVDDIFAFLSAWFTGC